MNALIKKIINPIEIFRAFRFHKIQKNHVKSSEDLELMLYSKILRNDMLHLGYFDDTHIDPESISIKDLENAQMRYAEIILEPLFNKDEKVLDVGCGMGGLSNIILNRGFQVESLTPDNNQRDYIASKYKELIVHHMKFEDFESKEKFGTVIHSESLQYIDLDIAFDLVSKILLKNGRWIIADFFRINDSGVNQSGHLHANFLDAVERNGWKIVHEKEMTENAIPTLKFAMAFIDRFVKPLALYANEKLRYKKAWLFYLTDKLRLKISEKSKKELAAIDLEKFVKEKRYMLYVLERQ